jgi:hypothetical protein
MTITQLANIDKSGNRRGSGTCLKYPTPAIGGLFYGVSSGSRWGGLPTRIQKTKIYNLETRK